MKLTAKEYAHRFGLSPRTVRLHLAQGKLPGSKEIDVPGVVCQPLPGVVTLGC